LENLIVTRDWLIAIVIQATACKIRCTKLWFY